MIRTLTASYTSGRFTIARVLNSLAVARMERRAARQLRDMSADRLEDIGLQGETPANQRHSGEFGPLPKADAW